MKAKICPGEFMAPQTTEEIERTPMSVSGHSSLVYVNPQSPSCSMSGISPFVTGIPPFATFPNTLPTAQIDIYKHGHFIS